MTNTEWSASQIVVLYAAALVVLGVLDGVWLGVVARDFYKTELGSLMADSPRLVPAAMFYLAYPIGLTYFALGSLSLNEASVGQALIRSAVFGLVAYGTYDLTNMSVIKHFSVRLGLIDMAWGAAASGVAGCVAFIAARWWAHRG